MTEKFVQTSLDNPIVFRTVSESVYQSSINTGSIWLRTSDYYRNIEDKVRVDKLEGVNATRTGFPLNFNSTDSSPNLRLEGCGAVGCEIIPHYIISMHGVSITEPIRQEFGGRTMGIKSLADLSAEVVFQVSKQVRVQGYRFGQVAYQNTALCISHNMINSAIGVGSNPPVALKSINTDVLRKEPVEPFIQQDEWRIVIFTAGYLNNDSNAPLKINVNPEHFYEYI